MIRAAQWAFAALVVATLGAFFVTQRLKQTPRLVQTLSVTKVYSPKVPYRKAGIRIRLKRTDDASVSILDEDGNVVRRLARNRRYRAGQAVQLLWNGRDDAGAIVPDGSYRVRVGLRRQGRSVTLVDEVRIDATPPAPVVKVEKPARTAGPLIFPLRGNAPVRFSVSNATVVGTPVFRVYRTDLPKPRAVTRVAAGPGATEGEWAGPIARAKRPPEGTYAIVAQVRDRAGNVGSSYPLGARGRAAPRGSPGVTVRYLAGQGPTRAVQGGSRATVFVDARRGAYTWRLHRLGQRETLLRGRSRRPLLRVRMPRRPSGVYLLELRSGTHRAKVPLAVNGPGRQKVLVVLPLVTWQGRNQADDDGDGLPNTLETGGPVRVARPFAGSGEPPGFARHESPLLRLLDRPRRRYDLETDYRARAPRPELSGPLRRHRHSQRRPLGRAATRRALAALRGPGRARVLARDTVAAARRAGAERPARAAERRVGLRRLRVGDRTPLQRQASTCSPPPTGSGCSRAATARSPTSRATRSRARRARTPASSRPPRRRRGARSSSPFAPGKGLVIRTGLRTFEQRVANPNVSTLIRRVWEVFSQ